jgi:hypothetical protein
VRILPWARLARDHRVDIERALAFQVDNALAAASTATDPMTAVSWLDRADSYLNAAAAVSGPLGAQPGSVTALRGQRRQIRRIRARVVAQARFGRNNHAAHA